MRPSGLPAPEHFEHGTRSRYVSGCRCVACKASNLAYYHQRQDAKRAAAGSVQPSGPPGAGVLVRAGVRYNVKTCPGAGGAPCIRSPAAWLRGKHAVCGACVERATVWNGNVDVAPLQAHLTRLRRAGVGYKSVAAASDVPASILGKVLSGRGTVRAKTAKRILEIDTGARADGAIAPTSSGARMKRVIARLLAAGFRKSELAWLLGAKTPSLQIGKSPRALVSTVAAVDRLWRKWERGELRPRPVFVPAGPPYAKLAELVGRGLDQRWLTERLGFTVNLKRAPAGMRPENAAAVDELVAEIDRRRREGEPMEEGWQQQAPEWRGEGWGLDRPLSKAAQKRDRAALKRLAASGHPKLGQARSGTSTGVPTSPATAGH